MLTDAKIKYDYFNYMFEKTLLEIERVEKILNFYTNKLHTEYEEDGWLLDYLYGKLESYETKIQELWEVV